LLSYTEIYIMKNILIPILLIATLNSSCDKNFNIAQVIKKRSELNPKTTKLIATDQGFDVKFNPVTPKYKLETREIVENFYNSKINRGGFWGQFLVAKNGEIIFEDYQGYSNYQNKEKITDSTPMHVASVGNK